jgi:hypothetical protein
MDFFAHPPRVIQKISTGTQQCFVSTMNVLFILQVGGVADRDLRIVCESIASFLLGVPRVLHQVLVAVVCAVRYLK